MMPNIHMMTNILTPAHENCMEFQFQYIHRYHEPICQYLCELEEVDSVCGLWYKYIIGGKKLFTDTVTSHESLWL